jgi:hypothetical protein
MDVSCQDDPAFVPSRSAIMAISLLSLTALDRKIIGLVCGMGNPTYPREVARISGHLRPNVEESFRRIMKFGLFIKTKSRGYKHHNVRNVYNPDPRVSGLISSLQTWNRPGSSDCRQTLDRDVGIAVHCMAHELVKESIWPSYRLVASEIGSTERKVYFWSRRLIVNSHIGLWPDTSSVDQDSRRTAIFVQLNFRRRKRNAGSIPASVPSRLPRMGILRGINES